jgi:hypothetical protein
MDDKHFTFLLESYKTAMDYFSSYADRVSSRFNILLTLDVAIAGVFVSAWLSSQPVTGSRAVVISLLGLMISVLSYTQTAQDRYLIKNNIRMINDIRKQIEKSIGQNNIPAFFSPLDNIDKGKRHFIFEGITCWRSSFISVTRVPIIISIAFIVFWIITLIIRLR